MPFSKPHEILAVRGDTGRYYFPVYGLYAGDEQPVLGALTPAGSKQELSYGHLFHEAVDKTDGWGMWFSVAESQLNADYDLYFYDFDKDGNRILREVRNDDSVKSVHVVRRGFAVDVTYPANANTPATSVMVSSYGTYSGESIIRVELLSSAGATIKQIDNPYTNGQGAWSAMFMNVPTGNGDTVRVTGTVNVKGSPGSFNVT